MIRRTTIELDDELLSRAQAALGCATMRATVEEACAARPTSPAKSASASLKPREATSTRSLRAPIWPFSRRTRCGGRRLARRQERRRPEPSRRRPRRIARPAARSGAPPRNVASHGHRGHAHRGDRHAQPAGSGPRRSRLRPDRRGQAPCRATPSRRLTAGWPQATSWTASAPASWQSRQWRSQCWSPCGCYVEGRRTATSFGGAVSRCAASASCWAGEGQVRRRRSQSAT